MDKQIETIELTYLLKRFFRENCAVDDTGVYLEIRDIDDLVDHLVRLLHKKHYRKVEYGTQCSAIIGDTKYVPQWQKELLQLRCAKAEENTRRAMAGIQNDTNN